MHTFKQYTFPFWFCIPMKFYVSSFFIFLQLINFFSYKYEKLKDIKMVRQISSLPFGAYKFFFYVSTLYSMNIWRFITCWMNQTLTMLYLWINLYIKEVFQLFVSSISRYNIQKYSKGETLFNRMLSHSILMPNQSRCNRGCFKFLTQDSDKCHVCSTRSSHLSC